MYDVIIIGGGCAGASTALSLLQQGVKNVAIIEKNDFSKPRVGETIQPPTVKLLEQLEVWEQFQKEGHLSSLGVASAWGTSDLAYSDFIFKAQGSGWHLDRNVFDKMMLRLSEQKGTKIFSEIRFKKASKHQDYWVLECDNSTLKTKFVVDATGRACAFAKHQGSQKVYFDDLHGIYTYWKQPENTLKKFGTTHTLVESVENGWWYSALLPNDILAVAFMTDTAEIKAKGFKETNTYLNQLRESQHTSKRISRHELQSIPSVKVAATYELDKMTGKNWLTVGDSASAYDPLSSYGIQKALHNGIEAGICIHSVLNGNDSALKKYEYEIKQAFEEYLAMRFKYYGMETRWPKHHFWKSRQDLIGIHPMQEFTKQVNKSTSHKNWNRILPKEDLKSLAISCESTKKAHIMVKDFQKKSNSKYPDWRVIQAINYLHNLKVIA